MQWYQAQGITQIEQQSPHSVIVPGAVDAWDQLVREHGNLDLSSGLREDGGEEYTALGKQRRKEEPYVSRMVEVLAKIDRSCITVVVRDEGVGFEPDGLPDPTDPANLQKVHGRGLMLIRTFMDEVLFNETANEITMVKRASAG